LAREQAIRCILRAVDHGNYRSSDTANQYGAGEAERAGARGLRAYPRDRYLVAPSLYFPVGEEPDKGAFAGADREAVGPVAGAAGREPIDLYQCPPGFDKQTAAGGTLALWTRPSGRARRGLSAFSEWRAEQIRCGRCDYRRERADGLLFGASRSTRCCAEPEGEGFSACKRLGIGNLAFSPLAHGGFGPGNTRRGSRLRRAAALPATR